jgi:hypothetical protein
MKGNLLKALNKGVNRLTVNRLRYREITFTCSRCSKWFSVYIFLDELIEGFVPVPGEFIAGAPLFSYERIENLEALEFTKEDWQKFIFAERIRDEDILETDVELLSRQLQF